MPSQQLNSVFNRAWIDKKFRESLFEDMAVVLVQASVPKGEIIQLLASAPQTIEDLAKVIAERF